MTAVAEGTQRMAFATAVFSLAEAHRRIGHSISETHAVLLALVPGSLAVQAERVIEQVFGPEHEGTLDHSASEPAGSQHETRVMPTAADVVAMAEHNNAGFVEVDGWVNTLVVFPGGSTVVYKAPTDAAVS
jgi:hypothetical protein